jgi:hypothetical protein
MIKDNHRIIIIFGMARSGTTIFTHVLSQHPSIFLFHNVYNYENNLIFPQKTEEIEEIVASHPGKFVLFKRPWSEKLTNFFKEEMPDATYLYILKNFDDIALSWKRTTWVSEELRNAEIEEKRKHYDEMLAIAKKFPQELNTKKFKIVHYNHFVADPKQTMRECCQLIGINFTKKVGQKFEFLFDTSMVKKGGEQLPQNL